MPTETIERLCEETKVEERARIADMRAAAATPAPRGFMSAKRVLCAAAYDEQFLNEQCRDENDLPESDDLPSNHPDGEQLDSYLAPRPLHLLSGTGFADDEESLFDAPMLHPLAASLLAESGVMA